MCINRLPLDPDFGSADGTFWFNRLFQCINTLLTILVPTGSHFYILWVYSLKTYRAFYLLLELY